MARFASFRRLLRRARSERGFTAVELLVVMVLLAIVMGSIATIYLSGVHTTANLTSQFRAQSSLHTGLNKMRIDVNLACSQTAQSATSVTLDLPPCDGTKQITWCTRTNGSQYSIYRVSGSSCTGGFDWTDYVTSSSIFTYTAQNTPSGDYALPRLHIDVTVNATPTLTSTRYRVVDDLVFRNGARQ